MSHLVQSGHSTYNPPAQSLALVMATLLDLPYDTFVLLNLHTNDLNSLSRTCKTLHTWLTPKVYSKFKYNGQRHTRSKPANFYRTLLKRPELAKYVQNVDLRKWTSCGSELAYPMNSEQPSTQWHAWMEIFKKYHHDTILALTLKKLVNLRSVYLQLPNIATPKRIFRSLQLAPALQVVYLERAEPVDLFCQCQYGIQLPGMATFLDHPLLHSFNVLSPMWSNSGNQVATFAAHRPTSKLRRLALYDCCIEPGILSAVLDDLKHLQSLALHFRKTLECDHRDQYPCLDLHLPREVLHALAGSDIKNSVEEMELLIPAACYHTYEKSVVVGSFRDWPKLKSLSISPGLLLMPPSKGKAGGVLDWSSSSSLFSLLPPSLKTLRIICKLDTSPCVVWYWRFLLLNLFRRCHCWENLLNITFETPYNPTFGCLVGLNDDDNEDSDDCLDSIPREVLKATWPMVENAALQTDFQFTLHNPGCAGCLRIPDSFSRSVRGRNFQDPRRESPLPCYPSDEELDHDHNGKPRRSSPEMEDERIFNERLEAAREARANGEEYDSAFEEYLDGEYGDDEEEDTDEEEYVDMFPT